MRPRSAITGRVLEIYADAAQPMCWRSVVQLLARERLISAYSPAECALVQAAVRNSAARGELVPVGTVSAGRGAPLVTYRRATADEQAAAAPAQKARQQRCDDIARQMVLAWR